MTSKHRKIWLVVLAVLALFYLVIESSGEGDLYIYLSAAGLLDQHGDLYATAFINEQYHYYYSVVFALLLKPFYYLPYGVVKFSWLLLNFSLFVHLLYLLQKTVFLQTLAERQRITFLLLIVIFSLRFVHENIHASQITILIFWCTVYGLRKIAKGRPVSGAFLLALAVNIKLLPLIFLPYLFYRGYFKAGFLTICFLFFLFAIPSVVIGHEYHLQLLKSWFTLINPTSRQHVLDVDERSFHGLSTLLATLFVKEVPDLYALPLKRNIADISVANLQLLLNGVRIVLLFLTLLFIRSLPFKRPHSGWQQILEVSYLLMLIPLIFPHQQHYAFLFIVPAFCASLYFYLHVDKRRNKFLLWALILIYLCSNLKALVGEFNYLYEHYKILTYGALLLIPVLILVRKKSASLNQNIVLNN